MSKPKIYYFDIDGGRGEVARLICAVGNIPFEDVRVGFSDWATLKPTAPFGAMPFIEVDGKRVSQCNAINRYLGRQAGLYPADAWEALLCDEVMDAVEDIQSQIGATLFLKDAGEKQKLRVALADGPIPMYLSRLADRLKAAGGEHFVGNKLSIADLKTFAWMRHLKSGILDHIPADIVARVAPALDAQHDRILAIPAVSAHYAARKAAKGK